MNSEYIIYVIDTETTGLLAEENDIIEISLCRFTMSNPTQREQKTWLLKALNPKSIREEALKVNKHKREDICHLTKYGRENYGEPSNVIAEIEQWFMDDEVSALDRIFVAQNPNFDIGFMINLWKKAGSPDTFPFSISDLKRGNRVMDTKQLALMVDICTGKRRRYYNLGSLVKSFGSKRAKAHTAAGDVEMTVDLFVKIISAVSEGVNNNLKDVYYEE